MRFRKPKLTTKVGKAIAKTYTKTNAVKTTIKKRKNPIKNLGTFAYEAKLPTGAKIGKSPGAKTTKRKLLNMRAQKGAHLNV